ncbi:hypothetical protein [Saccharothrix yanglingensis]|uniref:Uncharacterized protein n=1 Tax=Saccharothrix yanglingensis TaxID=659496 RepID=A0ABU0X8Q3_9PSEU|nr:hypothetical protein [Saccharothrix yanglingensis]MDQ2588511.1 hypothetical protein [Saccharothrix yanglingensis]
MSPSPRAEEPVLLVRRLDHAPGERERGCHLVPLPDGTRSALVTLCGERIDVAAAELLPEPDGVPCVACLLSAPPARP